MGNLWSEPGVPHKDWSCIDVIDLRANGEPASETDYANCQMCGQEKLRYVHIMEHSDYHRTLEVGCVCAEKMTEDYLTPKKRESHLRNRASRRSRWLKLRGWKISKKGNPYINIGDFNLVIYSSGNLWRYQLKVNGDSRQGTKTYPTQEEAKLALFDEYWAETQDGGGLL